MSASSRSVDTGSFCQYSSVIPAVMPMVWAIGALVMHSRTGSHAVAWICYRPVKNTDVPSHLDILEDVPRLLTPGRAAAITSLCAPHLLSEWCMVGPRLRISSY
jgi:hypothetical protein